MLHRIQQIKGASILHPLNPPDKIFSNLIGYSEKYKYRVGAPLKGRWPSYDISLVRPWWCWFWFERNAENIPKAIEVPTQATSVVKVLNTVRQQRDRKIKEYRSTKCLTSVTRAKPNEKMAFPA